MKAGLWPTLIVFAIVLSIAVAFEYEYEHLNPYWQGIAVESGGAVLEISLLILLLGYYENKREKQEKQREKQREGQSRIADLRRRIDDFKGLDNEYAHAVIASSLRELADSEITNIDFCGCRLTKFSFHDEDVKSLRGSNFAVGFWPDKARNNFGYMKRIDFYLVDCRDVKFSVGNLSFATYENCNFMGADLRKASFEGASLKWDAESVIADKSLWEDADETDEGEQFFTQRYYPAFDSADLNQTNFDKCSFEYADFRGAINILNASFIEAKGLDTCFFDEGIKEKLKVR